MLGPSLRAIRPADPQRKRKKERGEQMESEGKRREGEKRRALAQTQKRYR